MPPRKIKRQDVDNQIERIRKAVSDFLNENWDKYNVPSLYFTHGEYFNHIVNIGTSILCTKWEVGPRGGSFVKAVVNNDLMGAYGTADNVNSRCIHFYCALMYNINPID
jgi:hypothetical protein